MSPLYDYFSNSFQNAVAAMPAGQRRIGAELKFPLVSADGDAVSRDTVDALWGYLESRGWTPVIDSVSRRVVGARTPGERNDTVASCETGYCKTEFSLAHVADLHTLDQAITDLRALLQPFSAIHTVRFLGYGIHPVARPGHDLVMKKSRSSVWDRVFGSNRCLTPEEGDDVHLFTVNAASHVHISVRPEEAVRAVNVLNAFAGAQIALNAHSGIWKGAPDPQYKCVAEKFWDWWMPDSDRVGVPHAPFTDLRHYIDAVARFRPVFIMRDGAPLLLERHATFHDYYSDTSPVCLTLHGEEVTVTPEPADFDLHCTCYWHNARISRYHTVENRVNDQQPPDDLITVSALTLGLVSAAGEAWEEAGHCGWNRLRSAREVACCQGLSGSIDGLTLTELAEKMLAIADFGLRRRNRGEQQYLEPLFERVKAMRCPADEAALLFRQGGMAALLEKRTM